MQGNREQQESAAERLYVIGGTALAVYGMLKKDAFAGVPWMLAGGFLVSKGLQERQRLQTGEPRPVKREKAGIEVEYALLIDKPCGQVYAYWRNFENLPKFMKHLESVRELGEGKSSWIAKGPMDTKVGWDAEIVADLPAELIVWRSLPGATVENHGSVSFKEEAGKTRVHLVLKYNPPLGSVGLKAAQLMGDDPGDQIVADLEQFKLQIESGRVA